MGRTGGRPVGRSPEQLTARPPDRPSDKVQHQQRAEDPPQQLPRDPGPEVGDAPDAPNRAEQHAAGNEDPWDVEDREHGGERGTPEARPAGPRRVGKTLAQVQIDQDLRRHEQQQID